MWLVVSERTSSLPKGTEHPHISASSVLIRRRHCLIFFGSIELANFSLHAPTQCFLLLSWNSNRSSNYSNKAKWRNSLVQPCGRFPDIPSFRAKLHSEISHRCAAPSLWITRAEHRIPNRTFYSSQDALLLAVSFARSKHLRSHLGHILQQCVLARHPIACWVHSRDNPSSALLPEATSETITGWLFNAQQIGELSTLR